jgi:hypothetical protein
MADTVRAIACIQTAVTPGRLLMSNAMKYIRDLEAAGFKREQAEAQVQMVLDAIEEDLATKHDIELMKERIDTRFKEFELRVITRVGFITVSTVTLAVAFLAWLIRV